MPAASPAPGEILWSPSAGAGRRSVIGGYLDWLRDERAVRVSDYEQLWRWSVSDLEGFWSSVWEYLGVRCDAPYDAVLASREMPGARWCPGARLNYAGQMLSEVADDPSVAVIAHSQSRAPIELTFAALVEEVARVRAGLQSLGVQTGDRVAGYLPNAPEALIAFLACASLGAIWCGCAPELGARSVVGRLAQVAPTVMIAVAGYVYGERRVDRRASVREICAGVPSLRHLVHVPFAGGPDDRLRGALAWEQLRSAPAAAEYASLPFDHPLHILFSSGTTGRPKAIVHGHGGIILEHLKNHALSWDIVPGDRMLWFTTTSWMMWSALVSTLLRRASIVMVDGNPAHPDLTAQWRLAESTRPTIMGASPAWLMACRAAGVDLRELDLSSIRQLGAAGSRLSSEGFDWVYEQLGPEVLLNVGSGGTDVCSGILQGGPLQPVRRGEISGPCLGVDAAAYDPEGQVVRGRPGELVIRSPMPSMPIAFWDDEDGSRLRGTYFDRYPGIWRHGDWVTFTDEGGCVVEGRSDATLNRGGVRLGTGEFYEVLGELDGVRDSMVIHLDGEGAGELLLFVALDDVALDDALRKRIVTTLRTALSPRHVPDAIHAVPAIPQTTTGKKLEVPVKRILLGARIEDVADRAALADADSLNAFVALARRRNGSPVAEPAATALVQAASTGTLFESYAQLRSRCPVAYSEAYGGYWTLTAHRDVSTAAKAVRTFASGRPFIDVPDETVMIPISLNPPEHSAYRRLLNPFFDAASIERYRPAVEEIVERHLAAMVDRGSGDAAQDFATPVPAGALLTVLGLGIEGWPDLVALVNGIRAAGDDPAAVAAAAGRISAFVAAIIAERRRAPRDPGTDLLSALFGARIDGEPLSDEVIGHIGFQLVGAGEGTTRRAITNLVHHLAANSDVQSQVRSDPALLPAAIEESLRLWPSIHQLARTVTEPVCLGTTQLVPGDRVALSWAAANRDPDPFPNPDRWDPTRHPNRHLTFGLGIHKCLGARLARMELQVAVGELLRRTTRFALAGEVVREPGFTNGYLSLPLQLS